MKTKRLSIAILAVSAALALAPSASFAATNFLIQPVGATTMTSGSGNQCNSSGGGGTWQNWFINAGITNYAIIFDTTNAPPTGSTGSILQRQAWDGSGGTLATYACVDGDFWGGQKVDMAQYQSIEMDFKYSTASTMVPTANQGFDQVVNFSNNGNSVGVFLRAIYNTGTEATNFDGAWHHLSTAIPANIANATFSEGPGFKIFNAAGVTGTFDYWIANIELIARVTAVPNPTVTLEPIKGLGLKQFADAPPDYNRQSVRTDTQAATAVAKNVDWVGHPGAQYKWTNLDFPTASPAGFNQALTITPDPADGPTMANSDPDWSATNALWIHINQNADGSVSAGIYYKTNQPSLNGMFFTGTIYNPGVNGRLTGGDTLNAPSALGTWTLTFVNDTDLYLTAPNGSSTATVSLPPDVAAGFTNVSFALYSGMSGLANIGKTMTLGAIDITGVANPVSEDLTDGALNTSFLRLDSQGYGGNLNPPNQLFLVSSDAYWLHWTLPDTGFAASYKLALSDPYWLDYTPLNTPFVNGSARWVRVTTADLPGASQTLFALVKRAFVKLQVLLDGEVAAPNTPTGKTGTATHPTLSGGGFAEVFVRAVDADWNLVSSSDVVGILTSDITANLPVPATMAMVGGIANFAVTNTVSLLQFGSTGTFSVTATNITDGTKLSGTTTATVDP